MDNPEKLTTLGTQDTGHSKVYSLLSVLCLVYTMLTVSLDCPFLIAPLVLSNVYLVQKSHIYISRFSIIS
jgi:hypothetical protein